jgi:excisionase family DNA binding protein
VSNAPGRSNKLHPNGGPSSRRRYATISEAADYLRVNERTVRSMIASGRITGYRNGPRLVRVDLDDLDAAMQAFGGAV